MENEKFIFFRYISTIYRNTVKYLDSNFDDIGLGCNQQFFLTYINETQGITMLDLAKLGNFNKATITKAVKKLIESGYVTEESDEKDKRVKHLYVTEKAGKILDEIYDRRIFWEKAIEEKCSPAEIESMLRTLEKIEDCSTKTLNRKGKAAEQEKERRR